MLDYLTLWPIRIKGNEVILTGTSCKSGILETVEMEFLSSEFRSARTGGWASLTQRMPRNRAWLRQYLDGGVTGFEPAGAEGAKALPK